MPEKFTLVRGGALTGRGVGCGQIVVVEAVVVAVAIVVTVGGSDFFFRSKIQSTQMREDDCLDGRVGTLTNERVKKKPLDNWLDFSAEQRIDRVPVHTERMHLTMGRLKQTGKEAVETTLIHPARGHLEGKANVAKDEGGVRGRKAGMQSTLLCSCSTKHEGTFCASVVLSERKFELIQCGGRSNAWLSNGGWARGMATLRPVDEGDVWFRPEIRQADRWAVEEQMDRNVGNNENNGGGGVDAVEAITFALTN